MHARSSFGGRIAWWALRLGSFVASNLWIQPGKREQASSRCGLQDLRNGATRPASAQYKAGARRQSRRRAKSRPIQEQEDSHADEQSPDQSLDSLNWKAGAGKFKVRSPTLAEWGNQTSFSSVQVQGRSKKYSHADERSCLLACLSGMKKGGASRDDPGNKNISTTLLSSDLWTESSGAALYHCLSVSSLFIAGQHLKHKQARQAMLRRAPSSHTRSFWPLRSRSLLFWTRVVSWRKDPHSRGNVRCAERERARAKD